MLTFPYHWAINSLWQSINCIYSRVFARQQIILAIQIYLNLPISNRFRKMWNYQLLAKHRKTKFIYFRNYQFQSAQKSFTHFQAK